jgi:peptidoglycan-N-acetylglucosamine deacetylase
MTQLEAAYSSILGYFPSYMRPPYFYTNALVLQTLGGLGYHVIEADIDTLDYENATPALVQNAYNNFLTGINAGHKLELSHDVYATTVQTLAQEMINELKSKGLTGKLLLFADVEVRFTNS